MCNHLPTRRVAAKLFLLANLLLLPLAAVSAAPVTDLRVLVDVSGSMKQNDPENLRASALRLLVGLVPENSRSGVWTFGRYVNMSVKHQPVGSAWKAAARREAGRIHSRGLYTNIEGALEKAAYDWHKPDARFRRHMILLTDGRVDVDKDPKKNHASRERILQKVLPRLKRAGVHVHTIGLSANADAELLQTLSRATGGWHETVSDANQLQKVFLRLFEKSTPVNTLPIKGNRFEVDRNVSDMTLLVFRLEDAQPTALVTPQGQTWTAKQSPATVSWFQEKGYDLITVKGPAPGHWEIKATADPDNRVMVLTNLRLQSAELPNSLLPGETLQVRARLEQKGRTVTRPGFLNLVKFSVLHQSTSGSPARVMLKDDGRNPDVKQADGIFSARLNIASAAKPTPGVHKIQIIAKGATFERQQLHTVQVFESPAEITITKGDDNQYRIDVKAAPGLMQPESLTVSMQTRNGGALPIEKTQNGHWQANIMQPEFDLPIAVGISGRRFASDRHLEMTVERILAGTRGAAASKPMPTKSVDSAESQAASKESTTVQEKEETPDSEAGGNEPEEKSAGGWLWVVLYVLGINLLLLGLGIGGWWLWRRKRGATSDKNSELDYE